jgi:hypothetical protein
MARSLALAHPLLAARAARQFDQKVRPIGRLIGLVPRGATTLVLQPGDSNNLDDKERQLWAALPAWIALATCAPPVEQAFDPERPDTASAWDWLLIRGETHDYDTLGPNGAEIADLRSRSGDFRLYQVRH